MTTAAVDERPSYRARHGARRAECEVRVVRARNLLWRTGFTLTYRCACGDLRGRITADDVTTVRRLLAVVVDGWDSCVR